MSAPEALDFDNLGADHAISLYLAKVAAMNDNPTTDAMFEIAALAVNIVPVLADEIEALRGQITLPAGEDGEGEAAKSAVVVCPGCGKPVTCQEAAVANAIENYGHTWHLACLVAPQKEQADGE